MTVPPILLRQDKGSALTAVEHDNNWETIRDFCNALAALFGIVLNADGTLKDGAVSTTAKLADLIVTQAKLAWLWAKYGTATGTNTYAVTINPTTGFAYNDGLVLFVKFTNGNTLAACTIDVNAAGAVPITRNGAAALEVGDIAAGQIHILAYDGTQFQLIGRIPPLPAYPTVFMDSDVIPGFGATRTFPHPFPATPSFAYGYVRMLDSDAATGYTLGDTISLDSFCTPNEEWIAFHVVADSNNVYVIGSESGSHGTLTVVHKATGVHTVINPLDYGKYEVVVYAIE